MYIDHTRRAWLIALALVAAACAAEPRPGVSETSATAGEPPPAPSEDEAMMTETRAERALSSKPVTVRLRLPDHLVEVVRHLETAGDTSFLRLTLVGLETPAAEVSVRAFVNSPQAGPDTAIDNPRYLGDLGFYPTAEYGGGEAELDDSTFLLDLSSTLAALPPDQRLVDDRYVDVTLMVVPIHPSQGILPAPQVEIPFDSVRISVHDVGSGPAEDGPAEG